MPNISRSNGNWTIKYGQLIEYNMANIFLEKLFPKCSGEIIPRPFSKKSELNISLDQYSKVLYSLYSSVQFYTVRAIEVYWNKAADNLLLSHIKLF